MSRNGVPRRTAAEESRGGQFGSDRRIPLNLSRGLRRAKLQDRLDPAAPWELPRQPFQQRPAPPSLRHYRKGYAEDRDLSLLTITGFNSRRATNVP